MLNKAQFFDLLDNEAMLLKHLHSKITPAMLEYRPSAAQRSTLDLLRYLSTTALVGTRFFLEGNWDFFASLKPGMESMTLADFPAALDRQMATIRELLEPLNDGQLMEREATYVNGKKMPLGQALVMGPLRWLTAYRMQLFLYLKASGAPGLTTSNLWGGRDPEPKA